MNRVAPRSARSTLGSGELVAAACGLGLLVVMFIPWFSANGGNSTAWQAFSITDLLIFAAALAGLGVGIVALTGLSVSYPIAGSAIATGFGALAFACILIRLIDPPDDVDREIGVWLGLFLAAGVVVGGYLGMQEPAYRPDTPTPR
jgi:hypothetical protein